ncbi:MAG: hypothetical protein K9N49_03665, partial [Candidatus Marinimicrobia bacterium]|nr:hypothetical protein [Candidatus Neomarinimicrobiota bacterium]
TIFCNRRSAILNRQLVTTPALPHTPVQAEFTLDSRAGLCRIRANMNACLSIRPKQKERTAAARAESDRKASLSAVQR